VTIDSRILYGIMREISPESNVNREEFSGENCETYWKNIFEIKRLKVSREKKFSGMTETDGVAMCVHYRRLKVDRPVLPMTKHEKTNRRILRRRKCRITTLSLARTSETRIS